MSLPILFASVLLLLHLPISAPFTKNKRQLNFRQNRLRNLPNCKDQFKTAYSMLNIESLESPAWSNRNDSRKTFVTSTSFGCLETEYFTVKEDSVLEIPFLLSECAHGEYKLELMLVDTQGTFILRSLEQKELNEWNVFRIKFSASKNKQVPYKVLLRSYTKNCRVIIKHVHIRPIASTENEHEGYEAARTRRKRAATVPNEVEGIDTSSASTEGSTTDSSSASAAESITAVQGSSTDPRPRNCTFQGTETSSTEGTTESMANSTTSSTDEPLAERMAEVITAGFSEQSSDEFRTESAPESTKFSSTMTDSPTSSTEEFTTSTMPNSTIQSTEISSAEITSTSTTQNAEVLTTERTEELASPSPSVQSTEGSTTSTTETTTTETSTTEATENTAKPTTSSLSTQSTSSTEESTTPSSTIENTEAPTTESTTELTVSSEGNQNSLPTSNKTESRTGASGSNTQSSETAETAAESATTNFTAKDLSTNSLVRLIKRLKFKNIVQSSPIDPIESKSLSGYFLNKTIAVLKKNFTNFAVPEPVPTLKHISFALIITAVTVLVILMFWYLVFLTLRKSGKCNKCK